MENFKRNRKVFPLKETGGVFGVQRRIAKCATSAKKIVVYEPIHVAHDSLIAKGGFVTAKDCKRAICRFWKSMDEEEQAMLRVGSAEEIDRMGRQLVSRWRKTFGDLPIVQEPEARQ